MLIKLGVGGFGVEFCDLPWRLFGHGKYGRDSKGQEANGLIRFGLGSREDIPLGKSTMAFRIFFIRM